jgi:Uma2 family endonuclease
MAVPLDYLRISPQEYLEREAASTERLEYTHGQMFPREGPSEAHNMIIANLASALLYHLRGSACEVFLADTKVHLVCEGEDRFYYPDVLVTCVKDPGKVVKRRPGLIIEVLSPTSERIDRVEKFFAYRAAESLEELVLVTEDERRAEVYRRARGWAMEVFQGEAALRLDSVGLEVGLDEVYDDVELPA